MSLLEPAGASTALWWRTIINAASLDCLDGTRAPLKTEIIVNIQCLALILTLSCNKTLEVNGDCHPHGLAVILGPEAPHTDTQGLGARLRRQACKEERLFSEVVGFPTLAFICGKPGKGDISHKITTGISGDQLRDDTISMQLLDGLDLSFVVSLHSHNQSTRVQDAVVVRAPQRAPPVVTPVCGDEDIGVL